MRLLHLILWPSLLLFVASCASPPRAAQTKRRGGFSGRDVATGRQPKSVAPPLTRRQDCPIPGEVRHWEVAYCLWKTETEDEFSQTVQDCLKGEISEDLSIPKVDCERKHVLKTFLVRRLCSLTVESDGNDGQEDCFRERFEKFVPTTVKAGH